MGVSGLDTEQLRSVGSDIISAQSLLCESKKLLKPIHDLLCVKISDENTNLAIQAAMNAHECLGPSRAGAAGQPGELG